MNLVPPSWRSFLLGAALVALVAAGNGAPSPALAQTAGSADVLRPEVAAPLQAAEELIKAGKYDEALLKIREAEQIADRTAFEGYVINRMRGVAASGKGDMLTATGSFEAVIASGRSPAGEQLTLAEALTLLYFKAGDYAKAAAWARRYLKDDGTNPEMRMQLVRSLYPCRRFRGRRGGAPPHARRRRKGGSDAPAGPAAVARKLLRQAGRRRRLRLRAGEAARPLPEAGILGRCDPPR